MILHILALTSLWLILASPAFASCANPDGTRGALAYNDTYSVLQVCDGTVWTSVGGGPGILSGLSDVDANSASDGDVLAFNGTTSKWEASAPAGGALSGGTSGYLGVWSDTNTMGLSGSGSGQSLFWDATNHRLGIGTVTPTARLHVEGDILLAATLPRIASASYLTLQSGAGQAMTFNTGGATERLRIDALGNIGMGTASPTNPLSVDGTGQGSNDSAIIAYSSASNDTFSILPSAGVTYLGSGIYYKDGAWIHDGFNTSNALFAFGGMGGLWFASNNSAGSWNLTGGTSITLWNSSGVLMGASSRSFKEGFTSLDKQSVLKRISHLKIDEWKYRNEPGDIRHVGPVAEDWHAAFGTGDSDKYIPLVDSIGISLVGIQALKQENDELRTRLDLLSTELKALKATIH